MFQREKVTRNITLEEKSKKKEKPSGYNKSCLTSRWQEKVFFFGKVRPDENPKSARALPWVSIWLMLESVYLPSSYNNTLVGEFPSFWAATARTTTQYDASSLRWELSALSLSWANMAKHAFNLFSHLKLTHYSHRGLTQLTLWSLKAFTTNWSAVQHVDQ